MSDAQTSQTRRNVGGVETGSMDIWYIPSKLMRLLLKYTWTPLKSSYNRDSQIVGDALSIVNLEYHITDDYSNCR